MREQRRERLLIPRSENAREAQARRGTDFPRQRAFVVQLHAGAKVARGQWVGRVEHVSSGRIARFHTAAELLEFITQVLAPVGSPAGSSEKGGEKE